MNQKHNNRSAKSRYMDPQHGSAIRRRIEQRFDAILSNISRDDAEKVRQTPYARWLLDNSHLVRQALKQLETDLPLSYFRQLQRVDGGNKGHSPRVFYLIDQAIEQSGLPLDFEAIETFCASYKASNGAITRLTLGELWAVPIALRISLLERLCDAVELSQASSEQSPNLPESGEDVSVVSCCITSLRMVATFIWPDFVERTNTVDHFLKRDPSGFYSQMDFATRDCYRGAVEEIAERAQVEQWKVAEASLQLAKGAEPTQSEEHLRHIGFYLVDKGRAVLEKKVNYRPSLLQKIKRRLARSREGWYLSAIFAVTGLSAAALALLLVAKQTNLLLCGLVVLVALIPLLNIGSGIVNFAVSLSVQPRRLPKIDFSAGIASNFPTLVVVPMLISSSEDIADNLATLERNYLGNSDARLRFALLGDFCDCSCEQNAQDRLLLEQAQAGIEVLNQRYAEAGKRQFLLFHRRRLWNENEQCWMGWERKRGKLEEFNQLIRGSQDTSYVVEHQKDIQSIQNTQFIITLDADSYMPTGTAARLVGCMAHPLNSPRFDGEGGRVSDGYTVIQPRLEINPVSSTDTLFAKIFAGDVMLDLYTHAVSDVYQDLFAEGVFAGKGIYHVDAFQRSVSGQVPVNSVLSHDLLEGLLGRTGLASDIVLLEDYPSNYVTYLKRLHRWVRGDWQLIRWVFSSSASAARPFQPGVIGRWKLFDNLRRSLVMPAILVLLILAWTWLPGSAVVWTLLFSLLLGLPMLLHMMLTVRGNLWRWGTFESSLRILGERTIADLSRVGLALVFLPAEAYAACDAVVRTVYRVTVSHRRMLEWASAAQAARDIGRHGTAFRFWRSMWFAPAAAVASGLIIFAVNPQALPVSSPFLLFWFISPLIALRLSRSIDNQLAAELPSADVDLMRSIARDTWRFFERFVGPESNWLPPDNVQEYPKRIIAERTSPTNIGMLLVSTLTACDFGYLGPRQLLTRLTHHLESIEGLQKNRGHLLNWYSTRDLQPLEPRYVSTVDSGNLVAALVVVRQALDELPTTIYDIQRRIDGLGDELAAMRRHLLGGESSKDSVATKALLSAFNDARDILRNAPQQVRAIEDVDTHYCGEIERAFLQALEQNPNHWSAEDIANFREDSKVLHQRLRFILADLKVFAPWLARLAEPPALFLNKSSSKELQRGYDALNHSLESLLNSTQAEQRFATTVDLIAALSATLADMPSDDEVAAANSWLDSLLADIDCARQEVRKLDQSAQTLMGNISALIDKTDFSFLYDANRNLFAVGYNASTGEPDSSYYDLLASEARIASLVAIAKGDIPAKHWMHLGRPLTRIRGLRILLSWSATTFEYLMPRLFMRNPPSGLLDRSSEGAVRQQIRFGKQHGIPWGVSESGYAQFDVQGHYQYFAFGIPKLGLKWDQGERLVIASYASALALPYAPLETVSNFRRMIGLGGAGQYGLFEALDFGEAHRARLPRPTVVRSYMTHHQGMILVAIGNAIHKDEMPRRFHRDPRIASVEHLLYERLPQRLQTGLLEQLPSRLKELPAVAAPVTQWLVNHDEPELAVLSNGQLSSRISDEGGGALYWRGKAVTRWNPLSEGPVAGSCMYFKDLDNNRQVCLGGQPLSDNVEALFAPHMVEFRAHRNDMLIRMTIVVAPSDDVEIRRITITNDGSQTRHLMISSYSEPVLSNERADRDHLAFNKLFVEATISPEQKVALFRRRPREAGESPMYLAHTAITQPGLAITHDIEVDRESFLGRDGGRLRPAALSQSSYRFQDSARATVDPCAATVLTLDVPPRSTVQCAFLSSVSGSRTGALNALQQYHSLDRILWAVEAARQYSENELSASRNDSDTARAAYKLLAKILWPRVVEHIAKDSFDTVQRVQDSLWRHGISGDRAIITMRIRHEQDLIPASTLLKSLGYLSRKELQVDLILLDESEGGYNLQTHNRLQKLVDVLLAPGREHNGVTAFIVPVANLPADERANLIAAARVFIDTSDDSLDARLRTLNRAPARMPAFVPQPSSPLSGGQIATLGQREDLLLSNRLGGLLPDQNGYSLLIAKQAQTPAPWCNILANSEFGTLVSESGSMCTWWGNSSEYRLTPWSNDPVLDGSGETLYLRDEESGENWSLTPRKQPLTTAYRVTHSIGESLFENNQQGLEQRLQVFVDSQHAIKILRVRLTNKWPRNRRLTATFAAQWVLGKNDSVSRHLLLPEQDAETGALLVRNAFARHGSEQVAFVASDLFPHGVSCDGDEYFGRQQSRSSPSALMAVGLSGRVQANARPCAAYQVHIELQADETHEFHFVLGAAQNRLAANKLIGLARKPDWVDQRYSVVKQSWDGLLGTWQVKTPDVAADAMINHWFLYQLISSRLWGRMGFYQASGGFGFRDQLQDALALLDSAPELAREQIMLAASRQFREGDVLHWWHDDPLRGVRTRCSDDLLWLAFAVVEYINATSDHSILHDEVAFLQGSPLEEHELERYAEFQAGPDSASIYQHCYRAIDARLTLGDHGLPPIGTGDWSDGLNRVGEKGRGESVWMAWFLIIVCRGFAPLCRQMDDAGRADLYQKFAADLLQTTQDSAWAEDWYLRGYFDDGTPLGKPGDKESEIDLMAQTWAVLADPLHPAARQAMQSVKDKLIDEDRRLIKLLAPPFEKMARDPGYIRSYPPGVRENGGQYTHAAVWAAWAAAEMGDKQAALQWFEWLNPLKRARSEQELQQYKLEPYVTPGDIYGVGTQTGRGGWSWYTGSAAWLHRFAIQQLLGLQRRGALLFVRPCVPAIWSMYQATLRHKKAVYSLQVHNPAEFERDQLYVVHNGTILDIQSITLMESGDHRIEIFPSNAARQQWLNTQPTEGHAEADEPAPMVDNS